MSRTTVIIPVKDLAMAKLRLSPVLAPDARRRLVLTMLEDVLGVVLHTIGGTGILVVTPDRTVAALAQHTGATLLYEQRARGLNAAVTHGIAHALTHGAERVLVLPADVPMATTAEIATLVAARSENRPVMCIVPASDGDGSNALLLSPPDAISPSFGPGSYIRHLSQAVAKRIDAQVMQLPGLAADIDQPQHLAQLVAWNAQRYGFLEPHLTSMRAGHGHQH
jgi:2-phospho-L-lactate guanylyltransferase